MFMKFLAIDFQNTKFRIQTHTGEKSNDSEIRSKKFSKKDTLNSHLLAKTGEKRHTPFMRVLQL